MGRSPHNWNGYIGQGHIVPGLARLIQGSKLRGEPLPNILIPGNSGLGKTQLVQTIATDFGTKLYLINGRKDVDLIQLGLLAREWADGDIVFIDEGHSTRHDVQEAFYRIIDDRLAPGVETDSATGRHKLNGTTKVAAVTILLATDQPGALLPALKKRFALVMELTPYSVRELDAIVRQRATQKSMLLKPQAARLLAKTCRGIPRTAGHRLDALAKYWGAENPSVFTTSHVRKFLHAVGIDLLGMGTVDRAYLRFLLERGVQGASLRMLGAKLQVDQRYLTTDIEPFLIQNNFLSIDAKGRSLTTPGIEYAKEISEGKS
ncbi:MAG: Holliday junction DNA helicase RuvB C-terminal domain-containing protein [Planctomycetota bacterium]